MLRTSRRALLLACPSYFVANSFCYASNDTPIVGGGSSFIRPVMSRWAKAAEQKQMAVDYKVLGTGAAQNQLLAGEVDFAAVELPLSPDKLELGDLIRVPVAFGGMTLVVNIGGVSDGRLRLDAMSLGAIFSGAIRKWSDPRIAALNPDLKLPDIDVRPVFLGEPSGAVFSTSATLARYLIANNPDWQARFPSGPRTRWAVGSMVPSAEAMIPVVASQQGGIGYMALGTAIANKLATVRLVNKRGDTLRIEPAGLRAAVDYLGWAATAPLVVDAMDLPAAGAWPLVLPTYAIFPRNPRNKARGQAVREFLRFAITQGHQAVLDSYGIPLPQAAAAQVGAVLANG